MKGKSISGSVLDVSKGYTKLHLEIDQSQDSSQGEWFVQPSFYTGSGGYCAMPERGDVLSLHFPTEDERDCYIISAQGASSESLYNQISNAAADPKISNPGSGGGNQRSSSGSGNPAASVTEESMNKNKAWTTPGRRGLLLNDYQVKFHGSGGSTQLTLKKSGGILLASTKSIDISGKSIVLGGVEGPAVKVELTAGKELLLSCGESSLQMQSGSGDIQMYANEVKLESPRNAVPPDLLSQEEVDLLLSEYEKQKKDYLTDNILYYMDASGYTGIDIDQARQTIAYKIIDGLASGAKQLERMGISIKSGVGAGLYHQRGESMNMLLDIIYGKEAKYLQQYHTDRDDIAYQDALIAALGDDYQAGDFEDGYIFGVFAHVGEVWVWLNSVASLGNAFGNSVSGFMRGGGSVVTTDGMVFTVDGSVAISETFEAEITVAIAGILAAAGFGNSNQGNSYSRHIPKDWQVKYEEKSMRDIAAENGWDLGQQTKNPSNERKIIIRDSNGKEIGEVHLGHKTKVNGKNVVVQDHFHLHAEKATIGNIHHLLPSK